MNLAALYKGACNHNLTHLNAAPDLSYPVFQIVTIIEDNKHATFGEKKGCWFKHILLTIGTQENSYVTTVLPGVSAPHAHPSEKTPPQSQLP